MITGVISNIYLKQHGGRGRSSFDSKGTPPYKCRIFGGNMTKRFLKAADVVQKDILVSNLFLKLHFDQQKMTHYSLKEPFASLVALTSFQHGGGGWS